MTKVEERSKNVEHVIFFERTTKALPWILLDDIKRKKRANTTLYLHPASPAKQNGKLVKRQKKQLHRRKKVKRIDEIN